MTNSDALVTFKSTLNETRVEITGTGVEVRRAIRNLRRVFSACQGRDRFSYKQLGDGVVFSEWTCRTN